MVLSTPPSSHLSYDQPGNKYSVFGEMCAFIPQDGTADCCLISVGGVTIVAHLLKMMWLRFPRAYSVGIWRCGIKNMVRSRRKSGVRRDTESSVVCGPSSTQAVGLSVSQ